MSDDLSAKGECIGGNNDERASSTTNKTSSDDYSKFSYRLQQHAGCSNIFWSYL